MNNKNEHEKEDSRKSVNNLIQSIVEVEKPIEENKKKQSDVIKL